MDNNARAIPQGWSRLTSYGTFAGRISTGHLRHRLLGGERPWETKTAIEWMGRMKGLPLKVCEHLTMKGSSGWNRYREVVIRGAPLADEVMLDVIRASLGDAAAELDDLRGPGMAGSVAQVYRANATTESGTTDLAVKVFYPGIRDAVEYDLKGLERSVGALSLLLPSETQGGSDYLDDVLAVLAPQLLVELDGVAELNNLTVLHQATSDIEEIIVPRPVPALSNESVVTMEFLDGEALIDHLDRQSPARQRQLIERFVDGWFSLVGRYGLLHADLHPGNVLAVERDGEVVVGLIDAGQVSVLPEDLFDDMIAMAEAAERNDPKAAQESLEKMGFLVQKRRGAPPWLEVTRALMEPLTARRPFDLRNWHLQKALDSVKATLLAPPQLIFAMRSLFALAYYVQRYGFAVNWWDRLQQARQ